MQTNTSRQDAETQIAVLIAVAVSVFRVMMVLLWGGGHVCVSLLSDAWYKRSEEGKRQWHLEECVGERGRRAITFVCRFVHHFLAYFCIHTDVRFVCCVLHVCVCGYSLRLIVVSAFSSSPSLLRPCFLPNLLTSICLCL